MRIIIEEALGNSAKVAPLETSGAQGKALVSKVSAIEFNPETCRTFTLTWRRYVAYLVTEESVGSCGSYKDEIFTGKRLRLYTKSHLLDHIARDTGGHRGPIQHYNLICLNHLIDVVSAMPPDIEIAKPGESDKNR